MASAVSILSLKSDHRCHLYVLATIARLLKTFSVRGTGMHGNSMYAWLVNWARNKKTLQKFASRKHSHTVSGVLLIHPQKPQSLASNALADFHGQLSVSPVATRRVGEGKGWECWRAENGSAEPSSEGMKPAHAIGA